MESCELHVHLLVVIVDVRMIRKRIEMCNRDEKHLYTDEKVLISRCQLARLGVLDK